MIEILSALCYLGPDSGLYLEQELEKRIGLFVFQPDDAACEARIDVQGFLAGRLGMVSRMPQGKSHQDDYDIWERNRLQDARARSDGYSSPALCERTCHLASRFRLV
jgi:hypothetical protein